MSDYWIWWIAGAVLIAAELVTGTFYLLVIGLALVCGGVAAWLGAAIPVQWLIAARARRHRHGAAAAMEARPARPARRRRQGLDIGQMVQVQSWGPDGTARVAYRGSTWDAEARDAGHAAHRDHVHRRHARIGAAPVAIIAPETA